MLRRFRGATAGARLIEGRTVAIEYRWSEGRPERVVEIAAEFVQQKVDLIVAYGGAVTTLKQATASIPIVFAVAADPVRRPRREPLAPGRERHGTLRPGDRCCWQAARTFT